MKRYAISFWISRGYLLPNPLPPNPEVSWHSVESTRLTITARDPDAACHLVGHRWAAQNNLKVVSGPYFVTPVESLQHSPSHFPVPPPPMFPSLCVAPGDPSESFMPINITVRSCKEFT